MTLKLDQNFVDNLINKISFKSNQLQTIMILNCEEKSYFATNGYS